MKRFFLLSCLSLPLCGVACLLTLLFSGEAQGLFLETAGLENQGEVESYWIMRPTVIVRYSPTEIAALEAQASPVAPTPTAPGLTYPYAEFLSLSTDFDGQPVAMYRASETDFLRLCDYEPACAGDGYRYLRADLRPGGGIIYGQVRFIDGWKEVGLMLLIDEFKHLKVMGMIMEGVVYTVPDDHELRPLLDEAINGLNTGIDAGVLHVNGADLHLDAIQITDDELVVIYR